MSENLIDRKTFDDLKKMVGEDFIGELVDTYFEDSPLLMAELHKALDEGDAGAFRRAAHSLKSNSASLGASSLAAMAKELEDRGRDGQLEAAEPKVRELETAYEKAAEELKTLL